MFIQWCKEPLKIHVQEQDQMHILTFCSKISVKLKKKKKKKIKRIFVKQINITKPDH